MCLYPKLIKNPKYRPNKKNNYNPPICEDERVLYVPVGCGNCIECRNQKKREWQTRMNEEIKHDNTEQYRDWETDRKSTRLNSSHSAKSRMPSSA